jgi:glucosamine-phosphate N-acetyltransferase
MDNIQFVNLFDFTNNNLLFLETIKSKYIKLLSELTICNDISNELFINNISSINNIGIIYIGFVGSLFEKTFDIVCSGTIIIEPKIIRNGNSVGHIEDIVVKSDYRGKGISNILLNLLKKYGFEHNCYKIILDCNESVIKVYEKNGFKNNGFQMVIYK